MKDTYICFIETIVKLWRLFRAEKTHHGRLDPCGGLGGRKF